MHRCSPRSTTTTRTMTSRARSTRHTARSASARQRADQGGEDGSEMGRRAPKQLRHLFWVMQDGCCAICGRVTAIDEFEVDHSQAWVKSHDSSLPNLRGTCRDCNRRKSVHSWRKHQKELVTITNLMRFDPKLRMVVAWVTPGGGKSALPLIFGQHLIPIRGRRLAWITPRDNLRTQGESTFLDQRFRALLGHSLEIRATEPEADPCRATNGFITTYQSIIADAKHNRHFQTEFRQHSYLLVLDELQHAAVGSEYHRALIPLVDLSIAVLIMT